METSLARRPDWLSISLLALMLQVAEARLVVTDWTEFLFLSQTLSALGLILGLAIGYSMYKRKVGFLIALCYSILLIPWQLSIPISGEALLSNRLASLGDRLFFALSQFSQHEAVEDSLLFVAFISTLAWCIGLVTGYWWARHRNYLVSVIPGGVFTLIIHFYDPVHGLRVWLPGIYLLLSLLLLGRLYTLENRESWQERRVFQVQEATFDLMRAIAIAAVIFVFIAWTIPVSAAGWQSAVRTWNRFTKPWRELQEWFSNAVDPLESNVGRGGGNLYSNQLELGSGNSLADTVIFTVDPPRLSEEQTRYYWRGYVYDVFDGYRWYSSNTNREIYTPSNSFIPVSNMEGRTKALFTVTTEARQSLLYTTAQPVWVSRSGAISVFSNHADEPDLAAWFSTPGLAAGERYKFESALADPSVQDLQAAGTEYPLWVSNRYLQLPDEFSPRISALANDITRELESPYDKAIAITRYLRREIEYSNPLPKSPPTDEDPLEWILFDLKKGFCNYYASAEVLMLRSVGIPARFAAGFAEGERNNSGTYFVRSLDAHAWPEVFFPGIGWVEFEPTGNQPPLNRPNRPESFPNSGSAGANGNQPGADVSEADSQFSGREPEFEEGVTLPSAQTESIHLLTYFGAAALFILGLWVLNRRYAIIDRIPGRIQNMYESNNGQAPTWIINWDRWIALTPIERSFETINRSLRLLGEIPPIHATPAERAHTLCGLLPKATQVVETLTAEYQASLFSPDPGQSSRARKASLSIWMYTLQTLIRRLLDDLEDRFTLPGQFP